MHLRFSSVGGLPVIGAESSDPYMGWLMFETGLLLTQFCDDYRPNYPQKGKGPKTHVASHLNVYNAEAIQKILNSFCALQCAYCVGSHM